ncbi:hypothetical protein ACFQ2B_20540 [Streptomyces stramineus]
MDSVRRALCGALASVALCAAPAFADDNPATMSGTIELTPVTSHPGAQVQLRVAGCANNRATATSEAFVADATLAKDSAGLFAEATVRKTVAPGTYRVQVRCDGYDSVAKGRLTILSEDEPLPENDADEEFAAAVGESDADESDSGESTTGVNGDSEYGDRAGHRADTSPDTPGEPVAPVPAGGGGTATTAAEPPAPPGSSSRPAPPWSPPD